MPRNGAGQYQRPTGTNAISGEEIKSADYEAQMNDFASDMNAPRPVAAGGTGVATLAAFRAAAGLVVGTDVQAYSEKLKNLVDLETSPGKGIIATGISTFATYDLSFAGRDFLGETTKAGQRNSLGLGGLSTQDILDDPAMASNSTARPPSQGSVKTYVQSKITDVFKQSGTQTLAYSGNTSWNHGKGRRPDVFGAQLVCKSANNGYSVGHRISGFTGTSGNENVTIATDTSIRHSFADSNIYLPSYGGSGAAFRPDPSDWGVVLYGLWF